MARRSNEIINSSHAPCLTSLSTAGLTRAPRSGRSRKAQPAMPAIISGIVGYRTPRPRQPVVASC
jgi:hypothetical protein